MKIGVLGGTFDPIHHGHLYIAQSAKHVFGLDQVLFVVSNYPPHKGPRSISDAYHRYAMAALALSESEELLVSGVELTRSGLSYTIDTMTQLKKKDPSGQLCFIAGSDSLSEIHLWKDYDKLFSRHSLVFIQRPGAEIALNRLDLLPEYRGLISEVGADDSTELSPGRSFLLNLAPPPISSTEVRNTFRSGGVPGDDVIHPLVSHYIRKHRLYL